ncbi:MacB family efflux pump subunit [Paludibacterium yongneupense]|uniref:MacB family efflux pump subunit n=1 Tax=Paludibacterium yongneupense TaxID=400061 RepID=UPI0004053D48|nr:MacB family efflux pump subunit [Paludibacterium yongneupense]
MTVPLMQLQAVGRRYDEAGPDALAGIDLAIARGEMVAIVGASGSGKSTLMNILGCLDRPSRGRYLVDGCDVGALDADGLARLRREHFGFVFQRYHLLTRLSALENIALPASYAGGARRLRQERAHGLLQRFGLGGLGNRRPSELSGGQQQRVSIARALMNGGRVILADEPTGALDSRSGRQVMAILHELHGAGHTVILVTHDPGLAAQAQRVIEMRDGRIVSDSGTRVSPARSACADVPPEADRGYWGEAVRGAVAALAAHRLRSALATLGISIGIAAVVAIVALGAGARKYVLDDIRSIGSNTLYVNRGGDFGDDRAAGVRTFLPGDLKALAGEPWAASATPVTMRTLRLRYRERDFNGQVYAVAADGFLSSGMALVAGRGLVHEDVSRLAQVAVIDDNTRRRVFGEGRAVLGQAVMVGGMPATVVGVVRTRDEYRPELQVWLPYTTAAARLFGQDFFDSLTVRVAADVPAALAERRLEQLLTRLHGRKDFFIFNMDRVVKQMENTTRTLTLLLSLLALIALVVGGIGVMNIMLVSVSERTHEIGIRMAVGARQSDVRRQFLIEAVLVCLIGGVIGIALAFAAGQAFSLFVSKWRMIYNWQVVALAFVCASLIGLGFGYLPARKAARMDPVQALARE